MSRIPIQFHIALVALAALGLGIVIRQYSLLGGQLFFSSYEALGNLAQFSPSQLFAQKLLGYFEVVVFIPLYATLLWRTKPRKSPTLGVLALSSLVASNAMQAGLAIFCATTLPFEDPFYFSALAVAATLKWIWFGLTIFIFALSRFKN